MRTSIDLNRHHRVRVRDIDLVAGRVSGRSTTRWYYMAVDPWITKALQQEGFVGAWSESVATAIQHAGRNVRNAKTLDVSVACERSTTGLTVFVFILVGRVLGRDGLVLDYAPRCQATSGHPSRCGPNWVVRSANYDSGSIAYSLCSWTQATPVSGVSVLLRDDPNQLSSHGSPSHANHAAHPRTVSRSPRHDGAGVFSVV